MSKLKNMNPFCLQGGAEPGAARAVLSAYVVTVSFMDPSVSYKYDHFLSALRSESLGRMLLSGLFFGAVLSVLLPLSFSYVASR